MPSKISLSTAAAILISIIGIFINSQEFLLKQLGLLWPSYIDESLALLAFIICPLSIRSKKELWLLAVIAFPIASALYSITSNYILFSDPRIIPATFQSLINSKLILYGALAYCTVRRIPNISPKLIHILYACIITSTIGAVLNLAKPDLFIFSEASWQLERNRLVGFQFKPNDLGIFMSLAFISLLLTNERVKFPKTLLITCASITILSTSRTAILIILIGLIFKYRGGRGKLLIFGLLFIIPILAAFQLEKLSSLPLITETINNLKSLQSIDSSEYIRFIMLYYGAAICAKFIPFGVGAGNFGTVMSAGSPVYQMLGSSYLSSLNELTGVYDSNIASLLGEYGIAGSIIYLLLVNKILKKLIPEKPKKNLVFGIIIWIALLQPIFGYQVNSINILIASITLSSAKRTRMLANENSTRRSEL